MVNMVRAGDSSRKRRPAVSPPVMRMRATRPTEPARADQFVPYNAALPAPSRAVQAVRRLYEGDEASRERGGRAVPDGEMICFLAAAQQRRRIHHNNPPGASVDWHVLRRSRRQIGHHHARARQGHKTAGGGGGGAAAAAAEGEARRRAAHSTLHGATNDDSQAHK